MSLLDTASLLLTPNAYKEGKLYSVIPSNGNGDFTVTRATTATRVNSAGLVDLVPYNLLQYSEMFSNAAWTKVAVTISADSTNAPNGTTTADTSIPTTANAIHRFSFLGDRTSGVSYTLSIYAKASGYNFLYINAGTMFNAQSTFNLSNGTVSTALGTATITNVGDGWYRCSVTGTATITGNTSAFFQINSTNIVTDDTFSGNGTSGIFFWGAQLVEGTSARDYLRTETRLNIPRLDYSNGTCPSILVEPQRTNICSNSNNLSGGAWINQSTNTTLTRIQTGGVDGGAFDRLVVGGAVGIYQGRFVQYTTNVGANAIYSVYLKGSGQLSIRLYNGVNATPTIVTLTNKWTRYQVVSTGGSGTYIDWALSLIGGSTIDLAFHQVEFATYATSYIPTTSASVTRNADVISKTGISSLIGQTEGTVMIDINIDSSFAQTDMRFIDVSDNSMANWYFIGTNNANEIRFYFRSSNTTYVSITTTLTNGRHKLAFAYANNDYVAYVDGVQVHNTTTLAVGSTSKVTLGNDFAGFNPSKQFINASALWKTRLTNAQLATLTTI